MPLAAPILLMGLLAAPLPWLLGRMRRRRVMIEVPSLLLWERVAAQAGAPPARERRRALDLRTTVETAAIVAMVIAASGPRVEWSGGRLIAAVIDHGPSMRARGSDGIEREARARAWIDDADRWTRDACVEMGSLEVARSLDADLVVLFTDHDPDVAWCGPPPLIISIVPGGGANAGIVAGGARAGPDGKPIVLSRVETVAWSGSTPTALVTRDDDGGVSLTVPKGGDALPADDRIRLLPPRAALVVHWARTPPPILRGAYDVPIDVRRAIDASGAAFSDEPSVRGDVELRELPASEVDRMTGYRLASADVAPGGPPSERLILLDNPWVRFADPARVRVHVAPAAPPPDLRPVIVDEGGRIVVGFREEKDGALAWIGLPLHDPSASDWASDRSFPILFAELLAALAPSKASNDGLWRPIGLLDAAATRRAGPIAARNFPPDLSSIDDTSRTRAIDLSPALLALGAALAIAAMALARERRLPLPAAA